MYKNWKSPKLVPVLYNKLTVMNWIAEYNDMYLKQEKLATNEDLPRE